MPPLAAGRPAAPLALALALALGAAGCGLYIVPDRFYVVEADEAVSLAAKPGAVVLDVRPPADYEDRHAAGALSIPLSQLWARMDELPASAGTLIVLYDDDPDRALRAGFMLRREGYHRVHVCRRGLEAWSQAGGPVAAGPAPPAGWRRGVDSW